MTSHAQRLTNDCGGDNGKGGNLSRDIGTLLINDNSLTRDVGPLTGDVETLTVNIGALTSDVGALIFDIEALTFDVGTLTFDIGALTFDVAGLKFNGNRLIYSHLRINGQKQPNLHRIWQNVVSIFPPLVKNYRRSINHAELEIVSINQKTYG